MTAWAVTVWRDGTPVTDAVPVSDWLAGEVGAGLVASMFGGPVSLAHGVVEQRVLEAKAAEPRSLFEEVA